MEKFRKVLEDAKYPAKWFKDTPIEDILLQPGFKRLYTIQWCLSKFDSDIEKYLFDQDEKQLEAALWVVVTKMLMICSDCDKDHDIFLGKGELNDQIEFWKKVFYIVELTQFFGQSNDAVELELVQNTVESVQPYEKVNLIPMELKIASCDMSPNSINLFENQEEMLSELKGLEAEKNFNLIPPPHAMNLNLQGCQDAEDATAAANPGSMQESLQDFLAKFRSVYKLSLEPRLAAQAEASDPPAPAIFQAAAVQMGPDRMSNLTFLHITLQQLYNESAEVSLRVARTINSYIEIEENKLTEMREMLSLLQWQQL